MGLSAIVQATHDHKLYGTSPDIGAIFDHFKVSLLAQNPHDQRQEVAVWDGDADPIGVMSHADPTRGVAAGLDSINLGGASIFSSNADVDALPLTVDCSHSYLIDYVQSLAQAKIQGINRRAFVGD